MSRVPPYPASSISSSSRQRYPANNNSNGYYANGSNGDGNNYNNRAISPTSEASGSSVMRGGGNMNGPSRPTRSQLRSPQPGQTSTSQRPPQRDYREGGPGQQQNYTRDFTPPQSSTSAPWSSNEVKSRNRPSDQDLKIGTNSSRPQQQQQRPPYEERQLDTRTDGSWLASRGDPRDDDPNASPYDYDAYEESNPYEEVPTPPRAAPVALRDALSAFEKRGGRANGRESASPLMSDADGRELERRRQREREKEKLQIIQDRQDRRSGKMKAKTGDIDAVLNKIQDEWSFVNEPEFNPVTLALSLLDNSSAGRDLDSFQRAKYMLEQSLRGTIDKHYQHFAAALPHHATLITSFTKVQAEVTDARKRLQETRDALGMKRTDLAQLWSRGQVVEEMVRLLDEIDHLKAIPDILETRISEKRLLHAATLLTRNLKTINKPELHEIGALTDLRSYLAGQENGLRDIIVEELQGHLYLKAFGCDGRWAPYAPGQQQLPSYTVDDDIPASHVPQTTATLKPTKFVRFLDDLASRTSNESPADSIQDSDLLNAASAGPSAPPSATPATVTAINRHGNSEDSFHYIETLVESLAVLGKLGNGLDTVAQRLPLELFNLVEVTINEVRERADLEKRSSTNNISTIPSGGRPSSVYAYAAMEQAKAISADELRLPALEIHTKGFDREALRDFFWTLYSKLDAVVQGLTVLYEVSNRVGSTMQRRDFKDSSGGKAGTLFPLLEIWDPMQTEIRTLLRDYLVDQDQGATSGRRPIISINDVLKDGRSGRDRGRSVFRLGDTDIKATAKSIKGQDDEVVQVLKESVPGLVGGADMSAQSTLSSSLAIDDRFASAGSHTRLIKPDAFHVTVLFQPTLAFQNRVAQVLPHGMSEVFGRAGTTFLDEFVSKVYLPQLEEKVSSLFQQATDCSDAFNEDPASYRLSPKPVVKASTQTMALINSLCSMHASTPFHRENYSRLILDVIIRFYQRCYDRFVELVALTGDAANSEETQLAISARWAQKGEVTACLSALLATGPTWLLKHLQNLQSEGETLLSPAEGETTPVAITPITPAVETPTNVEALKLPLTKAMAMRYDALLKAYEQLAELVIHTIRVEIRCRIVHFLDLAMRQGNYRIEHEALEPEAHIVDLNQDLSACEDATSASLPERERRFIFEGLGTLMEYIIVSNARNIRFANKLGIQKIFRNILALQQNLKTLSDLPEDAEFMRARKYYELFLLTPEQLLESAKRQPLFSFNQYKSMLCLQCGVDQTNGDAVLTNKELNAHLIELHGLVVDDWEDTQS
ncbi:hypothetical protein FRB98_004147 [Tulasnella sp. 332]|nr:hypothetical protein FRB98_004147 [Tulasnella sp. 332]